MDAKTDDAGNWAPPLPETYVSGHVTYRVISDRADMDRASVEAGERLIGQIDFMAEEIRVDPDIPIQRRRLTGMHEALHAELHDAGFDDDARRYTVHDIIKALQERLVVMLQRNPEWVAFWCSTAREKDQPSFAVEPVTVPDGYAVELVPLRGRGKRIRVPNSGTVWTTPPEAQETEDSGAGIPEAVA